MQVIRDFHPDDLQQVSSLIVDTFDRHYNSSFYLTLYEAWKDGFLVAEDEKGLLGVLVAVISAPKESRILLMAVRPEYRNRGIGAMMLNELISRCFKVDIKAVNLEVRVTNEKAIHFYKTHGFDTLSLLPSYYEDGGAGYHMKKML
jgi:ribosomal-protein-alanine N-acetyltransferase